MGYSGLLLTTAFVVALVPRPGQGAPAQFWLSVDGKTGGTPEAAQATAVTGAARRLYVWASPQTAGSTQMENVSLNVVSPDLEIDIDPDTVEFYNPLYSTGRTRFEYVNDSYNGVIDIDANLPLGMGRGIVGLQGFRLNTSAADGFGGVCDANDPYCDNSSGTPAWLLASFSVIPNTSGTTAELFLQVGVNAMNHVGEDPADMSVMFGVDSLAPSPPAYDPSLDLQVTHGDDDPDAVLTLVQPGDYDADGDVDVQDYQVWRLQYGAKSTAADGNSDGVTDAADYTVWRDNVSPAPAGVATPEPTTLALLVGMIAVGGTGAGRRSVKRR